MAERKKNDNVNPEIAEARGVEATTHAGGLGPTPTMSGKDNAGNETTPQSPVGDSSPDKGSQELGVTVGDSSSDKGSRELGVTVGDSSPDKGSREKKEDLVDLIFPMVPGGSEYFECSINCIKYRFKKGIPLKVPRCVYELYASSNRDIIAADKAKAAMPKNVE